MTTDKLFSAASTTKAFTAAAASMIIEESKNSSSPINWDTPLASIIPEDFVLSEEHATAHTTLEDALSHRSGIPAHDWGLLCGDKNATVQENVRTLRNLPLSASPRTEFQYTNQMYIAVGHALQTKVGEPLGSFLKRRIWNPLGMEETFFSKEEARKDPKAAAKIVSGYRWIAEENGGHWIEEPEATWCAKTAAGGIVSNVLDYSRWVQELLDRDGPLSGHDSLTKPRIFSFEQGPTDCPMPYHGYALGWFVWHYRGEHLCSHTGGWPGYSSYVGIIPERKFGMVLMANSSSAGCLNSQLSIHLMDKILGLAHDPVHERKMAELRARQEEERMKLINHEDENVETIKQRLFPSLASPPIPHSLPLHKYTGVYRHPTGFWLTIVLDDEGNLSLQNSHGAIPVDLTLIHASGEFFVAKLRTSNPLPLEPFPVEFHVTASGNVHTIGLPLEPALKEKKIWFERDDS